MARSTTPVSRARACASRTDRGPGRGRNGARWLIARLDWERVTEPLAQTRANLLSAGIDADVLVVDEQAVVIGGALRPEARWRRGDTVGVSAGGLTREPARERRDRGDARRTRRGARRPAAWTVLVAQPASKPWQPCAAWRRSWAQRSR
jgi:hypothetical protein